MEHQRRKFLKSTGGAVIALTPGMRGLGQKENRLECHEDATFTERISRSENQRPLSQFEIAAAQRRAIEAYREECGSEKPISVGEVGPFIDFPLYSFAYTIDAEGRSSFMIGGPKDLERPQETPTPTPEETPTPTPEETPTPTPEETPPPTPEETLTPEEPDRDLARRIESAQLTVDKLQETAELSIPEAAEVDLTDIPETTTAENETTVPTTSSPMSMGLGTPHQDVKMENLVSLGVAVVETEAGSIITKSRLGLDQSLTERRAHLLVQDFSIHPYRDEDWRIQSAETVHDWRSGYSPSILVEEHQPSGAHRGKSSINASMGLSGPSASWSYSQPDITRHNLSEPQKAKWRWRWNRTGGGNSSETFTIGSLVRAQDPTEKGNHLCVVRPGATFQKGFWPFEEFGKVRIAQRFRYA